MEYRIKVRTPKGQATKAEKKLKLLITGGAKPKETFVNEQDDTLVLVMDTDVRKMMKVTKNVAKYETFVKGLLDNRLTKKAFRKHLNEEQETDLKEMLLTQTTIDIITPATAAEIQEADKSWWQRVKSKFKKKTLNKT